MEEGYGREGTGGIVERRKERRRKRRRNNIFIISFRGKDTFQIYKKSKDIFENLISRPN